MFLTQIFILLGFILIVQSLSQQEPFVHHPVEHETEKNEILFLNESELIQHKLKIKEMFQHAYSGYLNNAFPYDELTPLSCKGRNTLGGFGVTRIDTLPTLAIFGMEAEFKDSLEWAKTMNFDVDQEISIFETNIRVLGGLISTHLMVTDNFWRSYLHLENVSYDGELLKLAIDLADRLLKAFETPSGLPVRMINLQSGIIPDGPTRIFTAEAGSFILEFGVLTELSGNPVYKQAADRVVQTLWDMRLPHGLVGSVLEPFSYPPDYYYEQDGKFSGLGPGVDSFYEYLMKSYILFGEKVYLDMFERYQKSLKKHCKRGPWYIAVETLNSKIIDPLVWNLDAYYPAVLVLHGKPEDIKEAADSARAFFSLWQRFGFLPETFDIDTDAIHNQEEEYHLRPELPETFFYLFNFTNDPQWQLFGNEIMNNIDIETRTRCGFASINVLSKKRLDIMESFVLSETFTYLYLLYDPENPLIQQTKKKPIVFNTEAKPLWLPTSE